MRVRVPGSSANLGPGFDALGLAVGLYHDVIVDPPSPLEEAPVHERDPTAVAFRRAGGIGDLWVRSHIPAGRGLGFSGAARVGGVMAAGLQAGRSIDEVRRVAFDEASVLEGHADNVGASAYGGLVVTSGNRAIRVPLAVDGVLVVWVPPHRTSTAASRARLSGSVPFADAVFNVGRSALLVAALATGDVESLRLATEDRLHQDLRLAAVPTSRAAIEAAIGAGAWGAWLSGSGPTVAAMIDRDHAAIVAAAFPSGGVASMLEIDTRGAQVVDDDAPVDAGREM